MERNYDELIADILIDVANLQERVGRLETRTDLSTKRIVKLENRVEFLTKRLDTFMDSYHESAAFQANLNDAFLQYMKNNPK
jgi:hypothetical protein